MGLIMLLWLAWNLLFRLGQPQLRGIHMPLAHKMLELNTCVTAELTLLISWQVIPSYTSA